MFVCLSIDFFKRGSVLTAAKKNSLKDHGHAVQRTYCASSGRDSLKIVSIYTRRCLEPNYTLRSCAIEMQLR